MEGAEVEAEETEALATTIVVLEMIATPGSEAEGAGLAMVEGLVMVGALGITIVGLATTPGSVGKAVASEMEVALARIMAEIEVGDSRRV